MRTTDYNMQLPNLKDIENLTSFINSSTFIIMKEKELIVYGKDNRVEVFLFNSIEDRHLFILKFPSITKVWKDSTVHPAPCTHYYSEYLKDWSDLEIKGDHLRLCPPYDYIVMKMKTEGIVVYYKHYK